MDAGRVGEQPPWSPPRRRGRSPNSCGVADPAFPPPFPSGRVSPVSHCPTLSSLPQPPFLPPPPLNPPLPPPRFPPTPQPAKKAAPAPAAAPKKAAPPSKGPVNPLIEKRPKSFSIGGALPPKKVLHRFVKWPKYVRLQRQKRILLQRLKVPPALSQFSKTLDKNLASNLFKARGRGRRKEKGDGWAGRGRRPAGAKGGRPRAAIRAAAPGAGLARFGSFVRLIVCSFDRLFV